jgi:hypothetical protein
MSITAAAFGCGHVAATRAGRCLMAEAGKAGKKALIDAIMAEKAQTLAPEDIQSMNVRVQPISLKNQIVILDHDIDDPIMIINTVAAPEQ